MTNEERKIMTGIASLDNVLGGFRPGTLNVIAGMPGRGKTALAIDIAVNCAKEMNKVAFFSLEMFKEDVARRIQKNNGDTSLESSGLPILINDEVAISPSMILDVVNKQKVDIIIVDYLQLMTLPNNRIESRMDELKSITSGLKSIALELNIPVVVVSQIGRGLSNRDNPSLDDLCCSAPYLREYADSIIYVYSTFPCYLKRITTDGRFVVAKNDHGQTGTINVKSDTGYVYELRDVYLRAKLYDLIVNQEWFSPVDGLYDSSFEFPCIDDDHRWFITYDGLAPEDKKEFDVKKVLAISDFKQDHGWKLTWIFKRGILYEERNREENNETRRRVREALKEHIRYIMDTEAGWVELVMGSKLEKLFAKACTVHDIIDPYDIMEKKLYEDVCVDSWSEFQFACHYNPNGENTWRIAYGSIEWN